jgi:L-malate glycosyltransferase
MRNGSRPECTILHVNPVSKVSGAEVSLLTLMRHMDSSRYTQILACPAQGSLPAQARSIGITVRPLSLGRLYRHPSPWLALRMIGQFIASLFQLILLIRRFRVTIVHANNTTAAMVALPAAYLCRTQALWHIRDLTSLPTLARWLGKLATIVIVPTRHMFSYTVAQGVPIHKIQIVPNGIEIEPFRRAAQTRRSSETTFTIGMVAQIVPWKRHIDFIRAAAIIHQALPQTSFWLLGDDLFTEHIAYRQELCYLINTLNLTKSFSWLGFCDDIAHQFAALDVVLLPSCQEPFGRVLLEGLLAGAVPIAVNSAGPAEIIHHDQTGILVSCGDYHALADATIILLRNATKRVTIVNNGVDHITQYFGAQVTTHLFEQHLERLCRP